MARSERMLCSLIFITHYIFAEGINPENTHVFAVLGSTATIPCNVTKFNQYQWYKENKSGRIESVLVGGCDKPAFGRHAMTCSTNVSLIIENVNAFDAGTYYCTMTNMNPVFHSARTLVVTGTGDPHLSILAPMDSSGPAMLLCVASNWSDKWSPITWSLQEGESTQSNVDVDGTFRSLIIIPGRNKTDNLSITCSIKSQTGDIIQTSLEPTAEKAGARGTNPEDCYVVLYVGIAFIVIILLIHQIILFRRRQTVSKGHNPPRQKQRETKPAEAVVYSAIKSRENLSPQS